MLLFGGSGHSQTILISSTTNATSCINGSIITATPTINGSGTDLNPASYQGNVNWFVIYDSRIPQVSLSNPISLSWCQNDGKGTAGQSPFTGLPWTGGPAVNGSDNGCSTNTSVATSNEFYTNCSTSYYDINNPGVTDVAHALSAFGENGVCNQTSIPMVQQFGNGTYRLMCIICNETFYSDYFSVNLFAINSGSSDFNLVGTNLSQYPPGVLIPSAQDYTWPFTYQNNPCFNYYQYILCPGNIYASSYYTIKYY